jgi:hypothetical protein
MKLKSLEDVIINEMKLVRRAPAPNQPTAWKLVNLDPIADLM